MLLLNLYNDLCIQTLWKNTKKRSYFLSTSTVRPLLQGEDVRCVVGKV